MQDDIRPSASEEARAQLPVRRAARVTEQSRPLASLSDDDLLRRLAEILAQSRRVETELVAHIAEVDERRLYAREAFGSMFAYCTKALHLSESEAYLRIAAARASRKHPVILAMLGDGRLHLTGIALLAPHLTRENRDRLLRRAIHLSKRGIEELIAEISPRADVPALMRKLPGRLMCVSAASTPSGMGNSVTHDPAQVLEAPRRRDCAPTVDDAGSVPMSGDLASASVPAQEAPVIRHEDPSLSTSYGSLPISGDGTAAGLPRSVHPEPPPVLQPLSPGRYKVQFTASAQLREKLERLQDLMRSQIPDGDLAAVIDVAVTETLGRLEARRFGTTKQPRKSLASTRTVPDSRYIPAAVRRAVRQRDGNRCRFVDASGRRCEERRGLHYHHCYPFGMGGDHGVRNIRLMCRAHDDYSAECDYGRKAIARFRNAG